MTSPYIGSDITMLNSTLKSSHMPNFIQFGQAVQEIKTTFGLTGNDVTVHRKWHHHVEMHPQKPPYAKFLSIWPSGLPDKNYFRFIRKWHPHVEKHPQKTPYAKFYSIRPSGSRDKTYFRFNRKWRHRTPEVTSPCWKAPSKTPIGQILFNSAKRFTR